MLLKLWYDEGVFLVLSSVTKPHLIAVAASDSTAFLGWPQESHLTSRLAPSMGRGRERNDNSTHLWEPLWRWNITNSPSRPMWQTAQPVCLWLIQWEASVTPKCFPTHLLPNQAPTHTPRPASPLTPASWGTLVRLLCRSSELLIYRISICGHALHPQEVAPKSSSSQFCGD